MSFEVELRDFSNEGLLGKAWADRLGQQEHPGPQVDEPLAHYVVGEEDKEDVDKPETTKKNVVHISISVKGPLAVRKYQKGMDLPLAFLKIAKAIGPPKVMARTYNPTNSGCSNGRGAFQVREKYGREASATTNLKHAHQSCTTVPVYWHLPHPCECSFLDARGTARRPQT